MRERQTERHIDEIDREEFETVLPVPRQTMTSCEPTTASFTCVAL